MLFLDVVLPRDVRGLISEGYTVLDLRTGQMVDLPPAPLNTVAANDVDPDDASQVDAPRKFRGSGQFAPDTGELLRRFIYRREWSQAMALLTDKQQQLLQVWTH